jgi:tyrosyl-tRNA synthetase
LITKADGTKFGKTESGTVWLDPAMTTPYAFYQFWLNQDDRDAPGYLAVFTHRSTEAIAELRASSLERPQDRAAQKALAWDVTAMVHGETAARQAHDAARALFGAASLADISSGVLEDAVAGLPRAKVGPPVEDWSLVGALTASGLERSRGAARRTIQSGGVQVNNVPVVDPNALLTREDFLYGRFALLRRGRKTLAVAELVA